MTAATINSVATPQDAAVASGTSPRTSEVQLVHKLRAAFDRLPIGIVVTDRHCRITAANASACSSFRTQAADLLELEIGRLFPVFEGIDDGDIAAEMLQEAGEHMLGRRRDSSELPCEIALSRLGDEEGSLLWAIRDVTARTEIEKQKKLLEQELDQAHRLESLGTLAGGIAHELNTPIQFVSDNMRFLEEAFGNFSRAIRSYSQLLSDAENERIARECDLEFLSEEAPSAIRQSLEGLGRAADIVLAVKRFSHPTGDIKELNDLNQIIATTATVSKNQWKYIADLDLDLDPNLPPIKSNAGELNQVLINLIVNAAHAIEDKKEKDRKGRISISTKRAGNSVACSVSDSGVGIPPRIRDKIFDLFFTTKAPGRGTGQGLALVHKIITSHGGRITVDSDIGRGTRFIFVLPLTEPLRSSAPTVSNKEGNLS